MILDVSCNDLGFILRIAGYIFNILQWVIPIILILFITIDFAKAMLANDEKKMKEATSKAVKRLIYAVILFLIPTLVKFTFRALDNNTRISGTTNWIGCFNEYFE